MALSDLAKTTSPIPVNVCPMCWVGERLKVEKPDEHADLIACLENPGAEYTAISRELAQLGYRVRSDAVSRHTQGGCPAGHKYR